MLVHKPQRTLGAGAPITIPVYTSPRLLIEHDLSRHTHTHTHTHTLTLTAHYI